MFIHEFWVKSKSFYFADLTLDEFKSDNALYKDIKEKYCHLGASSQEASKQAEANIDYELPDGTKIQINAEKINLAANISFQTYIIDYDLPNVQDLLFKSISKAQIDFRKLVSTW